MVELWTGVAGFVLGAVVVAAAMEAMGRGRRASDEQTKLTSAWRLREFRRPAVMARDLGGLQLPPGTRVVASGAVDAATIRDCQVQQVAEVRSEFAIDLAEGRERALIWTAGARDGALAFLTVDPKLVGRLKSEFDSQWRRSDRYVERSSIAALAGRAGVVVETQGTVQDVLPFRDRYMIRLADQGHIIGVVVKKDPQELKEEQVVVRGQLGRDSSGYSVIEAEELHRFA